MSKIMVVEDDASLREIYGIRIAAEGYEVVSAGDGEEALAMAVREKPNLILSDVMMPKISGFDMLDILRATPETANIKIIMMTALSGDDQRQRGERLGADRYLVKSQVGIEDVVNVIHEVMGDKNGGVPSNNSNEDSSHTIIAVSTQNTPDMDELAQSLAADAEAQSAPQPTPEATATTEATPTLNPAPAETAPAAPSTDAPASDASAAPAAPAPEVNPATEPVANPATNPASAPAPAVESTATPEMAPTATPEPAAAPEATAAPVAAPEQPAPEAAPVADPGATPAQ